MAYEIERTQGTACPTAPLPLHARKHGCAVGVREGRGGRASRAELLLLQQRHQMGGHAVGGRLGGRRLRAGGGRLLRPAPPVAPGAGAARGGGGGGGRGLADGGRLVALLRAVLAGERLEEGVVVEERTEPRPQLHLERLERRVAVGSPRPVPAAVARSLLGGRLLRGALRGRRGVRRARRGGRRRLAARRRLCALHHREEGGHIV
mmetsp:Transcript_19545/g.63908  ORF Transcript_19545/g.63908 Transcript_19545/m.63908 type:complete len:206 (+) Transcript_19545:83-700(+)